jgi:hypothetical protein
MLILLFLLVLCAGQSDNFSTDLLYREKLQFHRPRSELIYSTVETESACTPPYVRSNLTPLPGASLHTAKSLEVFEAVANMLSVPCQHNKHSPIFICALALITMAQVSACNHVFSQGSPNYVICRERIRLYFGILKAHEPRWALAKRSIRELKSVARQLLSTTWLQDDGAQQMHSDTILMDQPLTEVPWDDDVFHDETMALFLDHEIGI